MRVTRVGVLAIGLLCVAIILVIAFRFHGPAVKTASMEPPMYAVENGSIVVRDGSPLYKRLIITPVISKTITHGIELPAQIMAEPDRQVNVLAPVTGRIISVAVHLGQHVTKGQILAIIAASDLDQAVADDSRARAALDFAHRAFARAQGVLAAGGNAVKDMESARNDLAQAQAEAERTQRRLQVLGARPGYSAQGQVPLVSPIDGVVSSTTMAPGQNITDSTAVQMTLLDLSEVWVAAAVPENRVSQIHEGVTLTATFTDLPGNTCEGPLATYDPTLHQDTRRLNAYLVCPNTDGTLHPGMFANAIMKVPQNSEIMVPKSALLMDNDRVSVFVEASPRTFRRHYVEISYDEGDTVRILSGVSANDRVVTSGAILLNDD
ncbi:efflux RND transporter periplasmic adaptor subunit [Gluconobacter wancherniae]|uniref:efflux RND transporter periplasmic adaptor subunit n=1 Tax=Gluconobacter wancherniae TaxID=1307955 RepID=UPI001B8C6CD1|nr:efflux RND transporter periplasmic adaptor subunit [Gluconobacter wancherniae]MBS1095333.1 efflux RND transporter periplasmic adaptor subunit [Gluconobacter wancherniae]